MLAGDRQLTGEISLLGFVVDSLDEEVEADLAYRDGRVRREPSRQGIEVFRPMLRLKHWMQAVRGKHISMVV